MVFESRRTSESRIHGVRFRAGWKIYVQYAFMRLTGISRADIEAAGDFLNYGITWDDAERVSTLLHSDPDVIEQMRALEATHLSLTARLEDLRATLAV